MKTYKLADVWVDENYLLEVRDEREEKSNHNLGNFLKFVASDERMKRLFPPLLLQMFSLEAQLSLYKVSKIQGPLKFIVSHSEQPPIFEILEFETKLIENKLMFRQVLHSEPVLLEWMEQK